MTLTRRLLILALIAALPAVVVWAYTEVALRRARQAEVSEQALRQAQFAAAEMSRILDGVHTLLIAVSKIESIRTFDVPACTAYLARLKAEVPHLTVGALDRNARIRCAVRPLPTEVVSTAGYVAEVLATDGPVVGLFTVGAVSNQRVLPVALPLRDGAGVTIGVMAASIDLAWLGREIARRSLAPGSSVTIADREGTIIAREPRPEQFVGTRIPAPFQHLVKADAPGAIEVKSQDGTVRVLGYVPAKMEPRDIYVSAGIASEAAFGTVNAAARQGLLALAAAFSLALTLAWLGSRVFITLPFQRLIGAIHAWRRGDYGARIAMPRNSGEFGLLADTFDKLMDDVQARESALRESEERARLALEAGGMGTWWYDPARAAGAWSIGSDPLLGLSSESLASFADWQRLVHPEDLAPTLAALERTLRGGGEFEAEYRMIVPSDENRGAPRQRWIHARGRALPGPDGRPARIVGVLQDISRQREANDRQQLLLDELNHRVKNTLATVQSIAAHTLRSSGQDPVRFRAAFEARILALSKTHDLLTRSGWRDADLWSLAEQELAPYRRPGEPRVTIEGPSMRLPARVAISLGLVIHELATNAAKYGALSAPGGRVAIGWTYDGVSATLRLVWRESGGPAVEQPTRQGFGSRLIMRSVEGELSGEASLAFAPEGLQCTLSIPLGAEEAEGDAEAEAAPQTSPVSSEPAPALAAGAI